MVFFFLDRIVCYFSSSNSDISKPGYFGVENINTTLCTHYIYAFATLDPITYQISAADVQRDVANGGYAKFVGLKSKNPSAKFLLAIGGASDDTEKYSKMANDAKKRANFINTVVPFLKKYGFDGLELDWEFPGQADKVRKHFACVMTFLLLPSYDGMARTYYLV